MKVLFLAACVLLLGTAVIFGSRSAPGRTAEVRPPTAPLAPAPAPLPALAPQPPAIAPEVTVVQSPALPAPDPTGVTVVDPPAVAPPAGAFPTPTFGAPNTATGAWGSAAAPGFDPRPFSEAHWQGLELIPKTSILVQTLGLPPNVPGVVVDDVSLPADLQGFSAGDLITDVGGVPTENLLAFIRAADRVRDQKQVEVTALRGGNVKRLVLTALFDRLGTANGETPTMIPSGARSPHAYQGPCTSCHRIGTTGSLATDQGDPTPGAAPPIRANSIPPHRDRGPCSTCHQIVP